MFNIHRPSLGQLKGGNYDDVDEELEDATELGIAQSQLIERKISLFALENKTTCAFKRSFRNMRGKVVAPGSIPLDEN